MLLCQFFFWFWVLVTAFFFFLPFSYVVTFLLCAGLWGCHVVVFCKVNYKKNHNYLLFFSADSKKVLAMKALTNEISLIYLKKFYHFTFPPRVQKGSPFSTSSPTFVVSCLVNFHHSHWCEVVFSWSYLFFHHHCLAQSLADRWYSVNNCWLMIWSIIYDKRAKNIQWGKAVSSTNGILLSYILNRSRIQDPRWLGGLAPPSAQGVVPGDLGSSPASDSLRGACFALCLFLLPEEAYLEKMFL